MTGGRDDTGRHVRDPVSELFDAGAARLLRRAYAVAPGWAGTPVTPPTLEHRAYFGSLGIELDELSQIGANPDPINRWLRGFVRACYYVHKWHYYESAGALNLDRRRMAPADTRALRYEVGQRARRIEGTRFYGTPVRIRLMSGLGGRAISKVPRELRYTENEAVRSLDEDRDW